jgi:hypothetical protein
MYHCLFWKKSCYIIRQGLDERVCWHENDVKLAKNLTALFVGDCKSFHLSHDTLLVIMHCYDTSWDLVSQGAWAWAGACQRLGKAAKASSNLMWKADQEIFIPCYDASLARNHGEDNHHGSVVFRNRWIDLFHLCFTFFTTVDLWQFFLNEDSRIKTNRPRKQHYWFRRYVSLIESFKLESH